MLCYRDRTFCPFGDTCSDSKDCDRAWTPELQKLANEWMDNPPVMFYMGHPECFKETDNVGS